MPSHIVVTATGLSLDERRLTQRLCETIPALASFSPSLTNNTTHLVAAASGSEKYKVASKLGIRIVRFSWVQACEAVVSSTKDPAAIQNAFEKLSDIHKLRPLDALVICVTGFELSVRNEIEATVKSLGAQFNSDLTRSCTHLVASIASGAKYEFARKHGITVVSKYWIKDCANTNDRANEGQFALCHGNSSRALEEHLKIKPVNEQQQQRHMPPAPTERESLKPSTCTKPLHPHLDNAPNASAQKTPSTRNSVIASSKKRNKTPPMPRRPTLHSVPKPSLEPSRSIITDDSSTGGPGAPTSTTNAALSVLAALERKSAGATTSPKPDTPFSNDSTMNHPLVTTHTRTQSASKKSTPVAPPARDPASRKSLAAPRRKSLAAPSPAKRPASARMSTFAKRRSSIHPSAAATPRVGSLFSGLHFAIEGFDAGDTQILGEEIECQDGVVHACVKEARPAAAGAALIRICPLGEGPVVVEEGVTIVSECWIEICLEEGILYDVRASVLFESVRYREPTQAFVVGVTGYEGLSREHVRKLVQAMHATYTDSMSKRNTHLIAAPTAEGEPPSMKLVRAREWGIQVVSVDWLFACARTGGIVWPLPEEDECITQEPKVSAVPNEGEKEGMGENNERGMNGRDLRQEQAVQEPCLVDQGRSSLAADQSVIMLAAEKAADACPVLNPVKGPELEAPVHEIKDDRIEEDDGIVSIARRGVEDSISDIGTVPVAHSAVVTVDEDAIAEESGFSVEFPKSDAVLRRTEISVVEPQDFRIAFDLTEALGAVPSPALSRTPTGLATTLGADFATGEGHDPAIMPLEMSFSTSLAKAALHVSVAAPHSSASTALKDVRLCVSEKARAYRSDTIRLAKDLGAEFLGSYSDERCTHLVHSGGAGGDKDFKAAKAAGKWIVSPAWLRVCWDKGRRVREEEFPSTVDVEKGLWKEMEVGEAVDREERTRSVGNLEQKGSEVSSGSSTARTMGPFERPEPAKTGIASKGEASLQPAKPLPIVSDKADIEKYMAAIDQLESSTAVIKRNMKGGRLPSVSSTKLSRNPSFTGDQPSKPKFFPSDAMNEDAPEFEPTQKPAAGTPTNFDPYASIVVYDDPAARAEKRRLIEQLQGGSSSKRTKKDAPVKRYFLLTGVDQTIRAEMKRRIKQLGGSLVRGDAWDDVTTHLICGQPANTEKCYAVCAKGAWMLREEYIEKSHAAGRFIDEEDFEWGNGESAENAVATASKCWRLKLGNYLRGYQAPSAGVYEHWIVLVAMTSLQKTSGFKRVLVAGGADVTVAEIANVKDCLDKRSFTHIFIDFDVDQVPVLKNVHAQGTFLSNISYICSYITDKKNYR
ncbi:hypothetical protein BC830DRAFT_655659 [Chytriomyces sp. MP71]|nr:hypothetical protein BC830DRAFT_655659 [Chytriomyces sp. MP71]